MKTKPTIVAFCLSAVIQVTGWAQLPQPVAPKPPVGVARDAKLFNGKWYAVIFEKVSWHSARDKCRSAGGQMVVIPDEVTWVFVKSLSPAHLWIGATDEKVEGVWMWVDGTPVTSGYWHANEPSNLHGNQHYMSLVRGGMDDLELKHRDPVGYICEWKAK